MKQIKLIAKRLVVLSGILILYQAIPAESIGGRVVDGSGNPIANVDILRGSTVCATTDSMGYFDVTIISPQDTNINSFRKRHGAPSLVGQDLLFTTNVRSISIDVFNIKGQKINHQSIVTEKPGEYTVNPIGNIAHKISLGVYFLRVKIGSDAYFYKYLHIDRLATTSKMMQLSSLDGKQLKRTSNTEVLSFQKAGYATKTETMAIADTLLPDIYLFKIAASNTIMFRTKAGEATIQLIGSDLPQINDFNVQTINKMDTTILINISFFDGATNKHYQLPLFVSELKEYVSQLNIVSSQLPVQERNMQFFATIIKAFNVTQINTK